MQDRRRFLLGSLSAGAVVLGLEHFASLGRAGWGTPAGPDDPALERARRKMKERGYWGVLLRVPEGAEPRQALGRALEGMFRELMPVMGAPGELSASEQGELALLLHEAVFVCVPAEDWTAPEGHDAVLLDEQGRRVTSARLDLATLPGLPARLRALLCADGRDARRAAVVEPPLSLLLGPGEIDFSRALQDEALMQDLRLRGPSLGRFLRKSRGQHGMGQKIEFVGQRALSELTLSSAYEVRPDGTATMKPVSIPEMPFGVQWKQGAMVDACPPCGMMASSLVAREFVAFLLEDDGGSKDGGR